MCLRLKDILSSQIFSVQVPCFVHGLSSFCHPGSNLRVIQSLRGTAFVFVVSFGGTSSVSAAFALRTGVQVSLSSVSSFPWSLHTAVVLVHLRMKAFGTLSPAEGDYTSRPALGGPVPASHSGLVFHFPSSILGSGWVQPRLANSDASFFTLLLIRSTPVQHAHCKPPQSKLSQSPDACSSPVPLYWLHRFLAHLIQLSAHISPSR